MDDSAAPSLWLHHTKRTISTGPTAQGLSPEPPPCPRVPALPCHQQLRQSEDQTSGRLCHGKCPQPPGRGWENRTHKVGIPRWGGAQRDRDHVNFQWHLWANPSPHFRQRGTRLSNTALHLIKGVPACPEPHTLKAPSSRPSSCPTCKVQQPGRMPACSL